MTKVHGWKLKTNIITLSKNSVCNKILCCEFGIDPNNFSHIINGHVPVKIKKGESPIKANSKLLVIDGGLSKHIRKSWDLPVTHCCSIHTVCF